MTTHPSIRWLQDADPDDAMCRTPTIRLADHAIGLWLAAEDLGDPALLDTLWPFVVQVARFLARDLMEDAQDETAHSRVGRPRITFGSRWRRLVVSGRRPERQLK